MFILCRKKKEFQIHDWTKVEEIIEKYPGMLFLTVKKLKALAKEWDLQTQQEFKDLYAKYLYLEASKEILKSGQNLERKSLKDRLKDFLHDSEIDEYFKLKIGESLHEQQIERENRENEKSEGTTLQKEWQTTIA